MTGTDDIFCTPQANLLHITPETDTKNNFKVEEAKRCVAIMGDWWEGLGFGINGPFGQTRLKLKSFIRVDLPPV